ncbi:hypothetical protein ACJEIK_27945 [Mycobacterium sp. SMC-16]|uniref:hypothetical protein n=1 Tax=Mycobacterium sp. SMC-16 TaxID=3385967 RepID=UPI00390CABC6
MDRVLVDPCIAGVLHSSRRFDSWWDVGKIWTENRIGNFMCTCPIDSVDARARKLCKCHARRAQSIDIVQNSLYAGDVIDTPGSIGWLPFGAAKQFAHAGAQLLLGNRLRRYGCLWKVVMV